MIKVCCKNSVSFCKILVKSNVIPVSIVDLSNMWVNSKLHLQDCSLHISLSLPKYFTSNKSRTLKCFGKGTVYICKMAIYVGVSISQLFVCTFLHLEKQTTNIAF